MVKWREKERKKNNMDNIKGKEKKFSVVNALVLGEFMAVASNIQFC